MRKTALSRSNPDEYLYGRAGYLYTLMFLMREIGHNVIDPQLITEVNKIYSIFDIVLFFPIQVFETMIRSGEKYARETGSQSPLMYQWYNTEYMGAAHGVSGIVCLLLKVEFLLSKENCFSNILIFDR